MILGLEQVKINLSQMKDELVEIRGGLRIENMERELTELREELAAPGFWDNLERSTVVSKRISTLEQKIKHFDTLCQQPPPRMPSGNSCR
jgi:peptide chain release factor 2